MMKLLHGSHQMKRITLLTLAALLPTPLAVLPAADAPRPATAGKPNIVVILADDLGYMDIGANNPKTFYQTPHIDRLAAQGMRFTAGYAACPVCSPTRASIMTGKYPPRTGITNFIGGNRPGKLLPAPNQDHLALEEVTLAEALRAAGYTNFFAGKWHLGAGDYSPNAQGFGPGLTGSGQFYYPKSDVPPPNPKDDPKTTDRIANEAVRFIETHKDKPFFAYLPLLAVHIPIGAKQELIEKYQRKKTSAPPDAWGQERDSKVRLVQNHAAYAAMIEQMDAAIGRVLAALERNGVAERTIVVFMSDNGGLSTAEGHPTSNLPLRAGKGWLYEGGIREPWIVRAPGVTRPGSVCDTPVVSTDFYPTIFELAGLPLMPRQHLDGVSLVPLLRGAELKRGPLYWHYPHYGNQGGAPGGAVRDGQWKLIEWYEDGSRELFNLHGDPGEQRNLAAENPEKATELAARLAAWRKEVNALMPTPNPSLGRAVAAEKPNVVLIISDDQGWTDYGFMGHPQVRTPHLDKLAADGLVFPRGYVPSSLCCPSLASIITGRYPHQHKVTCNDPPGDIQSARWRAGRQQMDRYIEAVPTLPRVLAQHGYVSFQAGKWWQDNFARGGFTHGMTTGDPRKGGRHGDEGLDIGRKTMQPVFDFIRQAKGDGKPFFVWYAPMLPHQPHNPPERLLAHYRAQAPNEHVAKYWAMVEWFDATCGQLLDFLDQQNLASNTLVLYVADNGWIQGPTGGSVRSKLTPYDAGLRTPIILRWPQHVKARRSDSLAMSIDLFPTVLAALGIERPAALPGLNLLDEPAVAARKTIHGECFLHTFVNLDRPADNLLWRWIIDGDWKLIVPHNSAAAKAKPELYNLTADPHEKANLAGQQPDRVETLRRKVDAWWTPE